MAFGRIIQIRGPVVDIKFDRESIPATYNAVKIVGEERGSSNQKINLTLEVQQHLEEGIVRCIALASTEGVKRGMLVEDTGKPISVPVGRATLGRLFNVLGEPIDDLGPVEAEEYYPIHRPVPTLEELETSLEVLETGIKVVDLLAPFLKRGKN